MSAEPGGGQVEPVRRSAGSLVFDLAVGAVLFVGVTIGFTPWYSDRLFERRAFESYYGSGVYRFRFLGREAVLWLDRVLPNDPLGSHLVVNGRHPLAAELFTAFFVLNAVSFLAIVLLTRHLLRRAGVTEPGRSLVVVLLLGLVAVSLSTVTPYDLPSVALIRAVLAAASARPPWDLLAAPLVVLGVCTRESALVAVAALVAHVVTSPSTRRQIVVAAAAGVAGAVAYLGIRLGSSSPSFWSALTLEGNVARLVQWIGLGLMAAAYLAWRAGCAQAGLGGAGVRRPLGWFWVLASPYLVTALLTGYWFEVRLLVPMLVGELWLRCEAARQQDTDSFQSASPLAALRTSWSRSSTVSSPAGSS
ncbi:MAG: hypothetical protein ACTHN0_03070 [Aquihabitans sp.]